MRKVDEAISAAWREASSDLGIRVIAPFEVKTDAGEIVTYEAFVAHFGAPQGTVTGLISDPFPDPIRTKHGYYAPNLGDSYKRYDHGFFVATLNDWKWLGDQDSKPSWYTGQSWT